MGEANDKRTPPTLPRGSKTFTFPPETRLFKTDPTSITVVPLTMLEELTAHKAAAGKPEVSLTYELVRQSVTVVSGKPVDWSKDDPNWLEQSSPTVRELACQAFLDVNRPAGDVSKAFLASGVVST